MLKKLVFTLISALFVFTANAGQMANVEYIHQLIKQEHNIDIKYAPDLISPRQAANMKYLLTAVDVANEILNGKKTTDYGNGEFATRVAVDTTATIQAVRTLIKQDYKFFITTTPDTTEFSFNIQASGEFMVDWGDGKTEKIVKNDTSNQTYSHTYDNPDEYTIKMGGKATGYTTVAYYPSSTFSTIHFPNVTNIAKIDGSLGEIFSTLSDGTNPIFMYTFRNARITTLPEELFRNISGTMSERMFYGTFQNSNISGEISEKLFSGIAGRQRKQAFDSTFAYCLNLTSIPENLFKNITEADFSNTFEGCTGLTSIPENLFKNITDATFLSTFEGCTGLTSIPENLFKNITDATFSGTFKGCTGLTSIPENLFANITFTNITNADFSYTFEGCTALTSIPENLFKNITDAKFSYTFEGCTGLTSIPENLFKNITDATFSGTFEGCTGLTSIPENLFAGISGAPASFMFYRTFYGCSGLTGSIPENLFAGIKGAPAEWMFGYTFYGCSGLTGSIPENLFAGISGAPAEWMFGYTFYGCSGLSGYIPPELFAGIDTDTTADYQMSSVFSGTGLDTVCPSGTVQYTTGFESWFNGKVSCEPFVFEPKFTATTTPDTTTFSFDISAAGRFLVDWGDGSDVQVITRTSTSNETYTHTYKTAGEYQIKIDGKATGYDNDMAISFYENQNLAKINGSLGQIFSTLSDGTQPRFGSTWNWRGTFQGCTNLTGEIPAELFSGISGAPAEYMFLDTFSGCSGLSGNIPENLFAGITGAPAERMFNGTFWGCSGLTGSIPEKLFAGVSGAPAYAMFQSTFYRCSGLSGSIPENLFAGISGAPANFMFDSTFYGCSGLSGSIPENLFAGIEGAPASAMFSGTFNGCSGLTGSIPENLFAGISGAPASLMFYRTFSGCSGLTSNIPENLFAGIEGAPKTSMFESAFFGCSGLTGYIPPELFAGISTDTTATSQMLNVFWNTGLDTVCPSDMKQYITGFEDYFDGKVSCEPLYDFTATTTPDTTNFSFNISASGTFLIDWGDGTIEEFTKTNTTNTRYYHTYKTAGEYKIGLTGNATGYNNTEAAISFSDNKKLAKIDGSLGAIFSTLSNGTQPRFGNSTNDNNLYGLFQNCTNLTGAIPENLFAGIHGAPVRDMFFRAFFNCYNLTGPIPENLFAGIKGAPVRSIFGGTFYGCSKLSGNIPGKLFAGISGAPANRMFQSTFMYCNKLTGYIPAELFAGLTYGYEERIFENTFTSTGLATSCPSGTQRYTTVFGSSFDGKAVCQPI